jgi:hypothetical protein
MRAMLYEAAHILLVRTTKMVLTQGLGDDRQARRIEEGGRQHRVPVERERDLHCIGGYGRSMLAAVQASISPCLAFPNDPAALLISLTIFVLGAGVDYANSDDGS